MYCDVMQFLTFGWIYFQWSSLQWLPHYTLHCLAVIVISLKGGWAQRMGEGYWEKYLGKKWRRPRRSVHCATIVHYWPNSGHTSSSTLRDDTIVETHWCNLFSKFFYLLGFRMVTNWKTQVWLHILSVFLVWKRCSVTRCTLLCLIPSCVSRWASLTIKVIRACCYVGLLLRQEAG